MDVTDADTIVGCTDGFKRGFIEGWAWRPHRPHDAVVVELLVNGVLTAEATACMPRPDLTTAGIGRNGAHAFAIPLPLEPDMEAVLHITVRAKGGAILPGGDFDLETSAQTRAALAHRRSLGHLEQVFGPFTAAVPPPPRPPPAAPVPRLNFILYSARARVPLAGTLGMPEYSYVPVMHGFREVLRRFGAVHIVRDATAESDAIYDACLARGESCVMLSFAPPQSTTLGLRCPTIPVIAWEFPDIPTGGWSGDPREDWRLVLRQTGRAITISDFAARAVRAGMGALFPVAFLPTPVWDRLSGLRARLNPPDSPPKGGPAMPPKGGPAMPPQGGPAMPPQGGPATLRLDGFVWDSRLADLAIDLPTPPMPETAGSAAESKLPMRGAMLALAAASAGTAPPPPPMARRQRLGMTLRLAHQWYREVLRDLLPARLARLLSIIGRVLRALRAMRPAPPPEAPTGHSPAIAQFPASLAPAPAAAPVTARYLPVGDCGDTARVQKAPRALPAADEEPFPMPELAVFDPDPYPPAPALGRGASATLGGMVFTAVLAPKDGRKNWQDILTAFTAAFRDVADATLVLKMIGADPTYWWWEFNAIAKALPPFTCRVLVLSGYLDEANYQSLIAATHFVVNASLAEGQCLPLVEFMSAGRPAIAPLHTAMLDYISAENAIIVASAAEFCCWPHDPRNHLLTSRHRIEWPSLHAAFQTAGEIIRGDTARYAAMQAAAAASVQAYCADATVAPRLAAFLGLGDAAIRRAGWQPLAEIFPEALP